MKKKTETNTNTPTTPPTQKSHKAVVNDLSSNLIAMGESP
jgi:hypothetical protein